jgi:hypothetical protein
VIVVTASVKEDERGRPTSHFRKPIPSVCHVTPHCEHAFFYASAFSTSRFILSAMDGKTEQRVCIALCETLEMPPEAAGEHH